MAAESVSLPGRAAETILLPPPDRSGERIWRPGEYRVDVLLGANVLNARLELPGEPPPVLRVPRSGPVPSNEELAGALARMDSSGALAMSLATAGSPTIGCLDGTPGPALEGAAAWLDVVRGSSVAGTCSAQGAVGSPHVLALLLPERQRITRASLVRLEPVVAELGAGTLLRLPAPSARRRPVTRLALFRASEGGPWTPGTYRIDAEWRDADGEHSGSWLLDVYPPRTPGPLLQAVQRATSVAGRWAILGGLLGQPEEQPRESAPIDTAVLGRTCDGATMIAAQGSVIAGFVGRQPTWARLSRIFRDGSMVEMPAFVVRDAVPGALIFAPVGDSVWRPGYYAIHVQQRLAHPGRQDALDALVFCVGLDEPTGEIAVPRGVDDILEFSSPPP